MQVRNVSRKVFFVQNNSAIKDNFQKIYNPVFLILDTRQCLNATINSCYQGCPKRIEISKKMHFLHCDDFLEYRCVVIEISVYLKPFLMIYYCFAVATFVMETKKSADRHP